jgi:hypothetical protein
MRNQPRSAAIAPPIVRGTRIHVHQHLPESFLCIYCTVTTNITIISIVGIAIDINLHGLSSVNCIHIDISIDDQSRLFAGRHKAAQVVTISISSLTKSASE